MIKKYKEFIGKDVSTLGEEIESLYYDEYVKNIVNRYISDIDTTIRVANAINLLDDNTKNEIKSQVVDYLRNGIVNKKPVVSATVDMIDESMVQQEISKSGKSVFKSFLKSITALGGKENKADYDICPADFLIYYQLSDVPSENVKIIFKRFKSLFRYIDLIDYSKNEVNLYFGIKANAYFEYGLSYDDRIIPIGQFKLNKSTINWILRIESKSAQSLKKDLVNLSISNIITLGIIKNDLSSYNPGYFEKKSPIYISDKIISISFYGLGNWNNGRLSDNDYFNIKDRFNDWLLTKKWSSNVLFSLNANSFWVNIYLKLKS